MKFSLYCILLFVVPFIAAAQSNKIRVEKIPDWVTQKNIDYTNTALDKDAENGYVDVAIERQVNVETQTVFIRSSTRIISQSGIEDVSQVSVNFDPIYQQVSFNTLFILRDGKKINKLDISKFKVVQQEDELDESVYNGKLSAIMILDDVRKGDIVEYSYTRKGFNPVFNGKFEDDFYTEFNFPVCNLYYKVVASQTRNITIKNFQTDITATQTKAGNNNIYEWYLQNVSPLHEEEHVPGWYDAYPEVMLSEFNTWKQVNDWALTLFAKNITVKAPLQKKIDEIKNTNSNDEARVLSALHFVQDEVRYMGIEIGSNSHKPADPNTIFANRYGDCKDKAYLLCTMLQNMSIDAKPVLISSYYKKALYNWLPSPYDFDHATVCVHLNGHAYFFDATIPYQRGPITEISFPDYQCGLVISDTTTALTTIPLQDKGNVTTKETFDIRNMDGKATLTVITKYTGSFADEQRDDYHSSSLYEIQKNFLKFYQSYYDNIEVADSVEFNDDSASGAITTTEHYNIDDIWKMDKGIKKAHFESFLINSVINNPDDKKRKMPYRIVYPADYYEDVVINLPEKWKIKKDEQNLNNPVFNLNAKFSYSDKQVLLHYHYKAIKDNVMPDEMSSFADDYDAFTDHFAYGLTYNDNLAQLDSDSGYDDDTVNSNGSHSSSIFFSIVLVVGLIVFLVRRSQR